MRIEPLAILRRAACFELISPEMPIYFAPGAYAVTLNDQPTHHGNTNVFSLYDLEPATHYDMTLTFASGERVSLTFDTPAESALVSVAAHGAIGDGITDCTEAIQRAIDACPPGGTVYVPSGTYLTYPLFLKSDMLLYLDRAAHLLGGADRARYPILPGMVQDEEGGTEKSYASWEGNPLDCYASLITITEATDVAVAGLGTLDGGAHLADWWVDAKRKRGAWRPRTLFAVRCERLTVLGVFLCNSPAWTVHPYYCTHVDLLAIRIQNPAESPNTDGISPDSCEHVRILGVDVSVGDDCVSIKSGKYYMAKYHPRPSRHIAIRNSVFRRGHGAIVIGSEVAAGVYDVDITQCVFSHTDRGLRVKTRRGRGPNSVIDRVSVRDVMMDHVSTCFVVNMFYFCDPDGHSEIVWSKQPMPVGENTPRIGTLTCERVHCLGASCAGGFFYGLPESPIEHVILRNVSITFRQDANPSLPAMMDDLEPARHLSLYLANVRHVTTENITFAISHGGDTGGMTP